ncbi:MFS transporter [Aestuariispira ectoiniformans]|uniref:MFS transporter n=1 Tax=Aestuariispira ectoiniformans TaxID=2775080 RepID=UPI00223BF57F|nr:MFS transporter [Aestuariispira ectoiniformans]
MEQTAGGATFRFLDKRPFFLLFLLFIGSLTTSSFVPLTGLFIVEGLGELPWKMSIYACIQVVTTLLVNRFYGQWIDTGKPLKVLPITSCLAFITAMLLISQIHSFLLFATIGAILIGTSGAALSAMYSFGRLFAEQSGRDPVSFNSLLRMQTSLAWMIGPAVSLIIYGKIDFSATFLVIALTGMFWLACCFLIIPNRFASHHPHATGGKRRMTFNPVLLMACIPVLLIGIGNVVYLSAAPLYFTTELKLPSATSGLGLTVKCFIEVPTIYFSGHLIRLIGERRAFCLAAAIAAIFFILIHSASSMPEVLALSVLDGAYYGIFAGVSMTYVQNAAPDRPGMATAYYVSTLFTGGLIGNFLTGMIASWQSFQATTLASLSFAILALIGLFLTRRRNRVSMAEETT